MTLALGPVLMKNEDGANPYSGGIVRGIPAFKSPCLHLFSAKGLLALI